MKTYIIPASECAEQASTLSVCGVENGYGGQGVGYFAPFRTYSSAYARFVVNIPKTVNILSAKVQSYYVDFGSSTAWTAQLRINKADNQAALTGRNLRTLTWTQALNMAVSGFTSDAYNDSASYLAAINAVFTRPGFAAGNSMLLEWYYNDADKSGNEHIRLVNVTGGDPPQLVIVTDEIPVSSLAIDATLPMFTASAALSAGDAPTRPGLIFEPEAGDPFLILATITHDDISTIRLAQNTEDVVSRGNTFTAFPFEVLLPEQRADRLARATLEFCNIDRLLVPLLRSVHTPPSIRIEIVLASAPDVVEYGPYDYSVLGSNYDAQTARLECAHEDILNEPFPRDRFTPNTAPGVFR